MRGLDDYPHEVADDLAKAVGVAVDEVWHTRADIDGHAQTLALRTLGERMKHDKH